MGKTRKEKWIAEAKRKVKPGSIMAKFQESIDWDESYRNSNRLTVLEKEMRKRYWFGWLEDIMFNIKLRKLSRKRKRKNK